MSAITPSPACPCGSGRVYADCCEPMHHARAGARTAEVLMRSRYSAFACALGAYLLDTWHPSTRPARLDLDPGLEWRRLQIRDRSAGGEQDPDGTVSFVAHFYDTRRREYGRLVETSRFIREDGRWLYLEAVA